MSIGQAEQLVESLHLAGRLEASAKSGLNVELAFREFTQMLIEKKASRVSAATQGHKVELTRNVTKKKKCC